MTIAYVNQGTRASGTISPVDVPYPATTTSGNVLWLMVLNKYASASSPNTPSGWEFYAQRSGGIGAQGNDSGDIYLTIFRRIADGTEGGGNVSVSFTGTINMMMGQIVQYSKTTGTWEFANSSGVDSSAGTSWSVTTDADPGVKAGDMVLAFTGVNGNLTTAWASQAISQSGITFGTAVERIDDNSASGSDAGFMMSEHPVSSGTSAGVITYTATATGSGTNTPTGPTIALRLREATGVTIACSTGVMASAGRTASIIPGAVTVPCVTGALNEAAPTATISNVAIIVCGLGALALNEHGATILPGAVNVACVAGALSLSEHGASVLPGSVTITCAVEALALSGWQASVSSAAPGINIPCGAGALSLSEHAAIILPGAVNVACAVGALSLNEHGASILPGSVVIACAVDALALNGWQASISSPPPGTSVLCGVGALGLSEHTASVLPGGVNITCTVESLALAGWQSDAVPGGVSVACAVESLVLSGHQFMVFPDVQTILGIAYLSTSLVDVATLSDASPWMAELNDMAYESATVQDDPL